MRPPGSTPGRDASTEVPPTSTRQSVRQRRIGPKNAESLKALGISTNARGHTGQEVASPETILDTIEVRVQGHQTPEEQTTDVSTLFREILRRMDQLERRALAAEEILVKETEKRKEEEMKRAEVEKKRAAEEKRKAEEEKVILQQRDGQVQKLGAMVESLRGELARTMAWASESRSYAAALSGGPGSNTPSSQSNSRVSFELRERPSGASYSPPESSASSPRISPTTSLRSALRQASTEPTRTGTKMTIDLKTLNERDATLLDTPAKIRKRLEEGLRSIDETKDIKLKDFKMWNTNDKVKLVKFEVTKTEEKVIRENCQELIDTHLRGARLEDAQRFTVKVDWVDKAFATDATTGALRTDAGQVFGSEYNVKVHNMRWLGRPRERAAHASAVVAVDSMEEAERLLTREEVTFGGCTVQASPYIRKPHPTLCYHCASFGHTARRCDQPPRCTTCGKDGHSRCQSAEVKCANCGQDHRATDQRCPEFAKEKERLQALHG